MTAPSPPDLRLLGLRPGTVPELQMGDDLAGTIIDVLPRTGTALQDGDVVVIASKAVSIAEKRYVDLGTVIPGLEAQELVGRTGKPAPLVQLIIDSADDYFLATPNVPIIARHRLGHQLTSAGIDHAGTEGAWLLPPTRTPPPAPCATR